MKVLVIIILLIALYGFMSSSPSIIALSVPIGGFISFMILDTLYNG